jgi:hypothetical protein
MKSSAGFGSKFENRRESSNGPLLLPIALPASVDARASWKLALLCVSDERQAGPDVFFDEKREERSLAFFHFLAQALEQTPSLWYYLQTSHPKGQRSACSQKSALFDKSQEKVRIV